MAVIVDYSLVASRMESQGMRCLYHNSGTFGFDARVKSRACGWIGPADPTVRAEAMQYARHVPPPYEANLTRLLLELWLDRLDGPIWAMPKSHWSYELQFGSREWLPDLLRQIGVDPALLASRNNAAAVEFPASERSAAEQFIQRLLEMLRGSDFAIAFPGYSVLCTLHHHKQLWWVTTDEELASRIELMPRSID